ncbi:hypothetical protein [Pelagibius sp. Alg239-R121]|uniref:hypothetical protein n=1 Tax=Pelagibius sp. Alg239-R121 TaxID=2993448 RepID=UPI0024A64E38|nr:hypothetical protein [Pelagibius sp. Alg239-R121]
MDILEPDILIKLIATATVVVIATLVAERTSSFVGAMIAALPISAGPAYLFIAMDHGTDFLAESALTGVGVNSVMALFLCTTVVLIPRLGIVTGLGIALSIWAIGSLLILQASLGILTSFVLNIAAFPVLAFLSSSYLSHKAPPALKFRASDIALRAFAVVCVVLAVLTVGKSFGPKAAGLMALVPVVWISMTIILYTRLGADACVAVLANGILAMFGYCFALTALHLITLQSGPLAGLSSALFLSVGWNLGLMLLRPHIPIYNGRRRRCGAGADQ